MPALLSPRNVTITITKMPPSEKSDISYAVRTNSKKVGLVVAVAYFIALFFIAWSLW